MSLCTPSMVPLHQQGALLELAHGRSLPGHCQAPGASRDERLGGPVDSNTGLHHSESPLAQSSFGLARALFSPRRFSAHCSAPGGARDTGFGGELGDTGVCMHTEFGSAAPTGGAARARTRSLFARPLPSPRSQQRREAWWTCRQHHWPPSQRVSSRAELFWPRQSPWLAATVFGSLQRPWWHWRHQIWCRAKGHRSLYALRVWCNYADRGRR